MIDKREEAENMCGLWGRDQGEEHEVPEGDTRQPSDRPLILDETRLVTSRQTAGGKQAIIPFISVSLSIFRLIFASGVNYALPSAANKPLLRQATAKPPVK